MLYAYCRILHASRRILPVRWHALPLCRRLHLLRHIVRITQIVGVCQIAEILSPGNVFQEARISRTHDPTCCVQVEEPALDAIPITYSL